MQKIQKQQASTKCKNTKTQGKMQKNQKSTPHRKKKQTEGNQMQKNQKQLSTKCKKKTQGNNAKNSKFKTSKPSWGLPNKP